MTLDQFKSQLKKMSFNEDKTSYCDDMLVNLHFSYPLDVRRGGWIFLRVAVCFYHSTVDPYFQVEIATADNKRFRWGTHTKQLKNAPSASQVLAYAIGDIVAKYRSQFESPDFR